MNWLRRTALTRLFRRWGSAPTPAPRFRPAALPLEDRTAPAANDLFANADVLTGLFGTAVGSNDGTTGELEPGEPQDGVVGTPNTVWYRWTAPTDGMVEFNTFGSELSDSAMAVYTGTELNNLEAVASNDDADLGNNVYQSQVVFAATAGVTYHVQVDGYDGLTGNILLNYATAPSNDAVSAAAAVAGGRVTGSNVGATAEAADPAVDSTLNTVWWAWTAPANGSVTADTVGSPLDTILAVHADDGAGGLTLLGVNDDADFAAGVLQSRVAFEAVAGKKYFFMVDGFQFQTGTIVLNLPDGATTPPPPAPPVNAAPVVADQSFAVDENSPTGQTVGVVMATDPEGQSLTYTITGGTGAGLFAVSPNTGVVSVAAGADLNHEAQGTYTLTVTVSDAGSPALSAAATVTVTVADVNEAPVFAAAGPLTVAENSPAGTAVGVATAADPDAGQTVTYAIVGGNEAGVFAIDPATGEVTVADPAALNYEATPTFTLTVRATDSSSWALTDETTVTVSLTDANDAPVLAGGGSPALAAVTQGASNPGTLVADLLSDVSVSDEDAGAVRGIAVVAANGANGTWQFSTDGGTTWTDVGAVSRSAARLLAADAQTRVRFVPNAGYSGTVADGLTFRAWDQTTGTNGGTADATVNGMSAAFSAGTAVASVTVEAAPVVPPTVPPAPTVGQLLQGLATKVVGLVTSGALKPGHGVNLLTKLATVARKLAQGKPTPAENNLNAFANKVAALVKSGALSPALGQELIAQARALAAML